jgi:DNA-binding transcriptional LysR family regulator
MFDLDLLKSLVSVVDSGGFTRAGERLNRTQSTVSQQIRRLEEAVGRPVFVRDGRSVRLTEEGERLVGYARRILALAEEARDAVAGRRTLEVVRLGVPDDFAVERLTEAVAAFARDEPGCRLHVRCGLSCDLRAWLARGDFDLILSKREPASGPAFAAWPERPLWIASRDHMPAELDPLPLVAFPQGCIYRDRAVAALEASGRRWRIAYESPNLMGIQAAIAGGLGIALLEARALGPGHRVLGRADGLPDIPPTELALTLGPEAPPAARRLAETIACFCTAAAEAAAARAA